MQPGAACAAMQLSAGAYLQRDAAEAVAVDAGGPLGCARVGVLQKAGRRRERLQDDALLCHEPPAELDGRGRLRPALTFRSFTHAR